MQNPVMYIIANKGLEMSPGKLAAQVAHAAVRAVWNRDAVFVGEWLRKGETKIVLEARDTEHLLMAERYLNARDIDTFLVIDEGRTEIPAHSATALASEIVDKNDPDVKAAFGDFKLYKPDDHGLDVEKLRLEIKTFMEAVRDVTGPDEWRNILGHAMDLRVGR